MKLAPTIVWFRHDLRLADNPALHAAFQRGSAVIPLFIYAPEEETPWQPGGASAAAGNDDEFKVDSGRLCMGRWKYVSNLLHGKPPH
jgi:hypothetical protein